MQKYRKIFCKCCAYSVQIFYHFFYYESDLGEDFFFPCLQQAIIVTLFSQTDFLT